MTLMKKMHRNAHELLENLGQEHVLQFIDLLDARSQEALLAQITTLDAHTLSRMQAALKQHDAAGSSEQLPEPAPVISLSAAERLAALQRGEELLASAKVGVILVAGGQGSRLGFDGPKGIYPVGQLSGASLFEIHARKVLALERKYRISIPFYIMTSAANDADTRAFFDDHNYFGRNKDNTIFFSQGMWPALTPEGRLILDAPGHIFESPDGHGGLLAALKRHALFEDMRSRGITTLFYLQVDNPLVNVADPVFLGVHAENISEFSIKVCAKRDANEGLGNVILQEDGRRMMLEYSELTAEQKKACDEQGRLLYYFGSPAIHIFDRAFMEQQAELDLPLHVAKKKVPYCDKTGITVQPEVPNACKFEKFIFDILPRAQRSVNLEFERGDEFSPLKNASGLDSVETCRRDMLMKWSRWIEECGIAVPRKEDGEPAAVIEIDPCYALGPEDLMAQLPSGFEIKEDLLLV